MAENRNTEGMLTYPNLKCLSQTATMVYNNFCPVQLLQRGERFYQEAVKAISIQAVLPKQLK